MNISVSSTAISLLSFGSPHAYESAVYTEPSSKDTRFMVD